MYKVKYLCPKIKGFSSNNLLASNINNYENNYAYTSYFIITYNNLKNQQIIKVDFKVVTSDSSHKINQSIVFLANNALKLSFLLLSHRIVYLSLSSSHSMYLGMELMKIELALLMNQVYIQN